MVSADNLNIVNLKNSIVSKINTLIGNHNESNDAHEDIRESIPTKTSDLVNDNNFISEEWGTFTELKALLDNASDGDTIVLDKNYLYGNESIGNSYNINKSLIIDGNNYIIDVNNKGVQFNISSKVNVQNVVLQNSQVPIFSISSGSTGQVNIVDCVFNNNSSSPIMFNGGSKTSNIISCEFNNNAIVNNYGCIFNAQTTGVLVKDCIFKNNTNSTSNNVGACIYNVTQQYHHIDVYNNTFVIDDSWENPLVNCTNYIGNYNDLNNKPTTPSKTIFYGTSDTKATEQTKIITTSSDFTLTEGTVLIVKFTFGQQYYSSSGIKLQINSNSAILVGYKTNAYSTTSYIWEPGEVVAFIYDGTYFTMIEGGHASTQYYGVTRLSNSTSSTSDSMAATPSAVKQAYDLANSKANVSDIPTKVSDLTNDSGFLTEHQSLANYLQKSNTNGLVKNDGTIDTNTYLTEHQSLANYMTSTQINTLLTDKADVSDIPTKTSDLTNDSNFITTSNTSGLIKNDGSIDTTQYLSQHQDISGKANSADLAIVATTGSYNDLTGKPTIPTTTNELTNNSGFLTSHQDISGKENISNKVTSWSNNPNNNHYPSERLVKDCLDKIGGYEDFYIMMGGSLFNIETMYSNSEDDISLFNKLYYSPENDKLYYLTNADLSDEIVIKSDLNSKANTNDVYNKSTTDSLINQAIQNKANTNHTHNSVDITDLFNAIYPIGSIYMSVNNTSPSTLFGGTWKQLEDTFLYATSGTADTGYQATAGSEDAVVVEHNHTQKSHNHTQNAHNHSPNSNSFLQSNVDVSINGTGRAVTSDGGSKWHYLYISNDNYKSSSTINMSGNTANKTATNQSQTAENNPSGVDGTGKNMPPYMKVYMWKRTA